MADLPKTNKSLIIYSMFILGILCTISFRVLTILSELAPSFVRPVWYFAVIGYIFFFLYRYRISVRRRKAVEEFELIDAVNNAQCLSNQQREVLLYITTVRSLPRW